MSFSFRRLSIPFVFAGAIALFSTGGILGSLIHPAQKSFDEQVVQLQDVFARNGLPEEALLTVLSGNCVRGLQPDVFEDAGFSAETWSQIVYELDVEEDLDLFYNQLCFITQYEWIYSNVHQVDEAPADLFQTLLDRLMNADPGMNDNAFVEYLMADLGLSQSYNAAFRNIVDTLNLTDAYDEMALAFDDYLDEGGLTDRQYYDLDLANNFQQHGIVLSAYQPRRVAYLTIKARLQEEGMEDFAAKESLDVRMDAVGLGDEVMAKTPCIVQQYQEVFQDMMNGLGMDETEFDGFLADLVDTGVLDDFFAGNLPEEQWEYLNGFLGKLSPDALEQFMEALQANAEDENNLFGQFEYDEDEWCQDTDGDGACDEADYAWCEDADDDGACDECSDGESICDDDGNVCFDEDADGVCDEVIEDDQLYEECTDDDGDDICDEAADTSEDYGDCADDDGDGVCDEVIEDDQSYEECTDDDGDGICDEAADTSEDYGDCADDDGDGVCDTADDSQYEEPGSEASSDDSQEQSEPSDDSSGDEDSSEESDDGSDSA